MRRNSEAGFTLIELIVSMVITAILAGMVALFARWPIQNYIDAGNRAVLTDTADSALRRMSRDIHQALPNSLRLKESTCSSGSGTCYFIEFIPLKTGGRYRVKQTSGSTGNILDLALTGDQTFDVIGPALCPSTAECSISNGDSLVYCNSTVALNAAKDAYQNPSSTPSANRRLIKSTSTGNNKSSLSFTGTSQALSAALAGDSCNPEGHRFYIVAGAVTYECPKATNASMSTLKRHSCYALQSSQPTTFPADVTVQTGCSSMVSAPLANQLDHCNIKISNDFTLLAIDLTLSSNGESIHLLQQIDLYNAP